MWLHSQKDKNSDLWHVEWLRLKAPDAGSRPGLVDLFPNSLTSEIITSPGGEKKEIFYAINEFGLRGPSPDPELKSAHLLISGDSYVFGQAVAESETISSYLGKLHPEMRVTNLGWSGGGIHTALRLFDLMNPREYSPEDNGTFIYVFVNFHIYRWLLRPRAIRWATPTIPIYRENDGKVSYEGNLHDYWPRKLFRLIRHSSFGRVLSDSLMNVGVGYRAEDVNSFFHGVEELRRRYLAVYPKGRFVFLIHPLQEDYAFVPGVKEEARRRGIELFDPIPDWKKNHSGDNKLYLVPGDGHPSKEVNKFLSQYIGEMILH